MGHKLHNRIEIWKKLLLDFGKRNRLINFLEGKRSNVRIMTPSFDRLWELVVANEKEIVFPYAKKVQVDDEGEEVYETVIKGDIETNKHIGDLQKTLKALRYKANTSIEEQGINTLYLTFGMLKWKERDDSSQVFSSPVILVPVRLLIESITSPYRLVLHDDEIVINPTLSHKLDNDFGIIMPEFDSTHDSPAEYIEKLLHKVENKGWEVERSTHLTNLSFLKINMYKDLERNEEKINANPVIAALVGEQDPIQVSEELNNFDHDRQIRPIDTFQVVDADSSQQDAVLLSKKGASFVLQGPPGTGKSQTITNIIAEAIADGKKVLFVSEKMAALQVVYNRLASVGLADFCFTLHSHKAKKKEILRDLANSINIDRTRVRDEALAQLDLLERKRNLLNEYQEELHTLTSGLNISIYSVNGKLAILENVPDVIFSIEATDKVTESELNEKIYLLQEFAKTVGKRSEDYANNVWRSSSVRMLTNELRHDIDSNVSQLLTLLKEEADIFEETCSTLGIKIRPSQKGINTLVELLALVSKSPLIPIRWIYDDNISSLRDEAYKYQRDTNTILNSKSKLLAIYNEGILELDGKNICSTIEQCVATFCNLLNTESRNDIAINIKDKLETIKVALENLSDIFEQGRVLSEELGCDAPSSYDNLRELYDIVSLLQTNIQPSERWFDDKKFASITGNFEKDRTLHESAANIRADIETLYHREIIEQDCKTILQRFNAEYLPFAKLFSKDAIDFSDTTAISKLKELSSKLQALEEKISNTLSVVENICILLGIDVPSSFVAMDEVICLAEIISKGITPTEKWFIPAAYNTIKASFDSIAKEHNDIKTLRDSLTSIFDDEIFTVDLYPMLQRFRGDYSSAFKRFFSSAYKRDLAELKRYMRSGDKLSYDNSLQYLTRIKEYVDKVGKLKTEEYRANFGDYYAGLDTNWDNIAEAFVVFDATTKYKNLITNKLKSSWIHRSIDISALVEKINSYKSLNLSDDLTNINIYLTSKFGNRATISVVTQEVVSLYNSITSFCEKLTNDITAINAYAKSESEASIIEYNNLLVKICGLQKILKDIAFDEDTYKKYSSRYGIYYRGIDTDWNICYDAISTYQKLRGKFDKIPTLLRNRLLDGTIPSATINRYISSFESCNYNQIYSTLNSEFSFEVNCSTSYEYMTQIHTKLHTAFSQFDELYSCICCMRKQPGYYDTIIEELKILIEIQNREKELLSIKSAIVSKYGNYYNELDTNWENLYSALQFADKFKDFITTYSLPQSFVESICTDKKIVDYCNDRYDELTGLIHLLKNPYDWFKSLFEQPNTFDDYIFGDLMERLTNCRNKKHLLEEWVDYCSNREKCQKAGLGAYIAQIDNTSIKDEYIVDAYLKRFYHLWLDAVLPNFPAVQNFRGRIQNQTINEFCELDKGQFKIAQARVRERALSRIPDFNSINGARDEIAILKRELNKQRRLMPLRKLFMAIPNLVTSLRPCFMMSPLSVSVFLEAQSYDFDLVIFDEASQVHTEDAIGAIMRGKQVIIVGDTKQLPPTSFFSTSLNDEDFDVDSDDAIEDNDAGAYESILDEAVSVLPERSLRWHYRSRHEHLIAFSNIKIYNSQLITFPSSTESAPDCGVEYVYVKDGIYDRGGKKNNIFEARKVADLVFEHFKKYPNRSLGVVTFSEAQQNAVDAAIRQKRLQNPRFDKFFIEDKEEPFFIKNLENVQGDERDTIIFSIGYAKDSKGIMYMNFGPLSREGGYRRLNVAITRAKHNVKLVGSIVPTDIDLEKVSSEGVKMLRSYIEFAQQGIVALEKELTFNYDLDFDSPFEEAVYDFLQSKDYNVVTQVGCSGFRIDMAVKHPTQSGKFAIGIECDGAAYHSSRTARERDRLRQAVLEDMGWTIYRIWSTDWIKDQKTEEEKLINAVEKALGRAVIESEDNDVSDSSDSNADAVIPIIEIEEKIEPSEIADKGYGFDLYKRAYPLNIIDEDGNTREGYDIVWDIISLEQPIHFEELCRRIAPAYGRQKATSVVRDEVKYIFRNHLKGMIIEDKNEFVRIKDFADVKVRVPNPDDDYLRPITYICNEELALAMKTIAQHSFGITPDDLFIVTAREFGFKRTGENIIYSLRKVYQQMLKNGEVTEVDDKVSVVQK